MSCSSQVPTDSLPHPLVLTGLASTESLSHWTLRSAGYVVNAFSFLLQNLAYEIILTLGQAFEVAYQLALQARKGGHSSTLPESFENKPSKPIPKPRVSIRKSVVSRKDTEVLKTVSGRERGCSPGPCQMWVPVRIQGLPFLLLSFAASQHMSIILSAQCLKSMGNLLPLPGGSQEHFTFSVTCSSPVRGTVHCYCL